jgi:hypothetical protein
MLVIRGTLRHENILDLQAGIALVQQEPPTAELLPVGRWEPTENKPDRHRGKSQPTYGPLTSPQPHFGIGAF